MSTDSRVNPIIAYSFHSTFDSHVPAADGWLQHYRQQIGQLDTLKNVIPQSKRTAVKSLPVGPYINSTWGEKPIYNTQCPYDEASGEHTTPGSVVVAMAQIMQFWGHPYVGTGSFSYTDPIYGTQSAGFANTIYRWQNTPDSLTAASTQAQRDAVNRLLYHCAVATETYFNTPANGGGATYPISYGSSSIISAESALRTHFKYNDTLQGLYRSRYSNGEWLSILKRELDEGRPVLYSAHHENSATGRSFICDGYDADNYFHFNWGYGGASDGYYTIDNLSPTLDTFAYHFVSSQNILIGISPDRSQPDDTNTVVSIAHPAEEGNPAVFCHPNPVNDRLIVEGENIKHIKLTDVCGRSILQQCVKDEKTIVVDIQSLHAGIYLLCIATNNGIVTERIIKK